MTSDWPLQTYSRITGLETRIEFYNYRLDHTKKASEGL